ncbi:MAG: hypothetical protein OXG42_09420, partial [Chloroflexi bacterium]|nr:hypothetical protein [Chloroflexota bacterium]
MSHTTTAHFYIRSIAVAVLLASATTNCGLFDGAGVRTPDEGPVTIATVWPWESRSTLLYGHGLQMAVDEVNEGGGVLGRPLTVLRE